MARKGWDNLTDKYRRSLLRHGITAERYADPAPFSWGIRTPFQRHSQEFALAFGKFSAHDPAEIRANIRGLGERNGEAYMRDARRAIRAYIDGDKAWGNALWLMRPYRFPADMDYMYYYHPPISFGF